MTSTDTFTELFNKGKLERQKTGDQERITNLRLGGEAATSNCLLAGEQLRDDSVNALAILEQAAETIRSRAASRDLAEERSAQLTVEIFNAITGKDLTEQEGWIFLLSLKLARSRRGAVNPDDFVDLVGYSALLAECSTKG